MKLKYLDIKHIIIEYCILCTAQKKRYYVFGFTRDSTQSEPKHNWHLNKIHHRRQSCQHDLK